MFKRLRAWFFAARYYGLPEFVVNSAPSAENIRVNMTVAVNSAAIRTEIYNGREHLVLPSYTLPDDVVMNGGLYPHEEIERSYKSLEGTFAPLGHPQVNGVYVPAGTPEAINAHHIGAFNRNVERKGNRIHVEKWLDKEVAANTEGGRRLLKAIEERKPIHTSTGIFLNREPVTNAKSHRWIARNMIMDHDAILLDEPGAATPEDGVGLLVNARVEEAVALESEDPAQIKDWLEKNPTINRILQLMGLGVNSDPLNPSKPQGESEMTPEELQKALAANNEALLASVKGMVDPLSAAVSGLQANHKELSEALTANSRAAEANKRKLVAEKLGQAAADLLTGNALDEVHAKFVGAAPLIPGFAGNNDTDGYQATKLPE